MRTGCDLFPLMYLENENGPELRLALIVPLEGNGFISTSLPCLLLRSASAGLDLCEKV